MSESRDQLNNKRAESLLGGGSSPNRFTTQKRKINSKRKNLIVVR
jgi:hypothetical protein